jgi:periplasmic divalent cation tolerance protein
LSPEAVLVVTQVPDRATADRLAAAVLERRLAACVSIGTPVDSLYHWRGRIETAREIPVVIKAPAWRYADIEATIRELHPYELPEVIAVPVSHGLRPYLDWLAAEASDDRSA